MVGTRGHLIFLSQIFFFFLGVGGADDGREGQFLLKFIHGNPNGGWGKRGALLQSVAAACAAEACMGGGGGGAEVSGEKCCNAVFSLVIF